MTPESVLASERRDLERLKALPRRASECEYHGYVMHVQEDDEFRCLPCAVERVDSMAGAIPVPDESETCPNCGEPHVWHGRDEKDRVCFQCRYPEDR